MNGKDFGENTLMLVRSFNYDAYKFFLVKFGYAKYNFGYLFM